jgi:hypothetical protein
VNVVAGDRPGTIPVTVWQQLPRGVGDARGRKYTGKFNTRSDFPGFNFVRGDQLVISGTFNGPLPTGSSVGAKLRFSF